MAIFIFLQSFILWKAEVASISETHLTLEKTKGNNNFSIWCKVLEAMLASEQKRESEKETEKEPIDEEETEKQRVKLLDSFKNKKKKQQEWIGIQEQQSAYQFYCWFKFKNAQQICSFLGIQKRVLMFSAIPKRFLFWSCVRC